MNITHRRRAIYTGLKPFLKPAELMQALKYWELEFSTKPTYAVNVFISRCCTTPDLKARRSEMLRSVVNAMDLDESQLLPDPGSQINTLLFEENNRREGGGASVDIQTRMFMALVSKYFSLIGSEAARHTRLRVSERLFEIKTRERRVSAMHDYISGKSNTLETSFYLDFLQQVFNLIYVETCDAIGPVKADSCLAMALRTTEPIAAESAFNLRQFL